MSDGEKLHKILEFMSKVQKITIYTEPVIITHGRKSTYTHEELLNVFKPQFFKNKITVDEISRLCAILTMDGLGKVMKKPGFENNIGGTIGINIDHVKVSEAYRDRKYLANEKPLFIDSPAGKWILAIFAILRFFGFATIYELWLGGGTDESKKIPTQTKQIQQKEPSEKITNADSTDKAKHQNDSLNLKLKVDKQVKKK